MHINAHSHKHPLIEISPSVQHMLHYQSLSQHTSVKLISAPHSQVPYSFLHIYYAHQRI